LVYVFYILLLYFLWNYASACWFIQGTGASFRGAPHRTHSGAQTDTRANINTMGVSNCDLSVHLYLEHDFYFHKF